MAYVGTPIDTTNQFQSLVGKRFSGDASTTAFTLDVAPSSTLDIEVFVENVRQDPNSAYSLSGTTLTFAAAPPSGTNNIYVVHQAKAVGTISPAAGTVNADSFDNTVISGHTALAATPADTDEFLISDAGTIKRIDYSYIKAANTPAFEAYAGSDLSLSNNVHTKQQYNTEVFDTDSAYDNSSNYRFTPQTAGKYFVYAQTKVEAGADSLQFVQSSIYKNGSQYREQMHDARNNNGLQFSVFVSAIVDMNGSSDYVEGYIKGFVTGGDLHSRSGTKSTSFGAFKIIGA